MTHTYSISGMTCSGCADKVKHQLEQHAEVTSATVALESNEATITMNKHVSTEDLQSLVNEAGNYTISMAHNAPAVAASVFEEESKSWLQNYKPLLLVFLFIAGIATLVATTEGQFLWMRWMNTFMAGFFIAFSFFKFLDLRGFADSYRTYDLLAKQVPAYGFVYPFIELALGVAYLTYFEPQLIYGTTIVVMGFSSIGVIQSVLKKRKIHCACLGTVFNLPMSTVTIIEDLLMVVMAAVMLVVGG